MAKILSDYEISTFCREMSILIRAGITPLEGINELLNDSPDDEVLKKMRDTLEQGDTLNNAIKNTSSFPTYVENMTKIAEEAGALDTVLISLSDYYENEERIKESIKSAVTYPLLIISMMLIVIILLITKVLPIFRQVFAQLGGGVGGLSQSLISFGEFMNKNSFILVIIVALIAILLFYFGYIDSGRRKLKKFASGFGPTKSISNDIASSRIAGAMALMLRSGIPVSETSVDLIKGIIDNDEMTKKMDDFYTNVEINAMGIPEAFKSAGIFSGLQTSLMSAGFKSGDSDSILEKISINYLEKAQKKIYSLINVIEPTLVIVLSLVVGMILLSVILPLMGIMSGIGG